MSRFGRSMPFQRLIALSVAFVCAPILPTTTLAGPAEVAGAQSQTLNQYREWMVEARARHPYPHSVDKMYRVMICESGGNPNARGGGGAWLGLFQYSPRT